MDNLKVLLTAVGCPGGPSVARALKLEPGWLVVGTDMNQQASGRFFVDKFYQTLSGSDDNFIPSLLDVAEIEKPDVLLPQSSNEVMAISKAKKEFESLGIKVLVSKPKALEIALNKLKTYDIIGQTNVPIPRYYSIESDEKSPTVVWNWILHYSQKLGFPHKPVVIKRPEGKGSRGISILVDDLIRMGLNWRTWPAVLYVERRDVIRWVTDYINCNGQIVELMIMEYLVGDESSADTFDGYGPNLGYTKIRRDCRFGVHHSHESKFDQEMMFWSWMIAVKLGLEYFINIQFMDRKLLEINPRISTQIITDNYNLPVMGVKLGLGLIEPEDVQYPDGRTFSLPDGQKSMYYLDLISNWR